MIVVSDDQVIIAHHELLHVLVMVEYMSAEQLAVLRGRLSKSGLEPRVLEMARDLIDAVICAAHKPDCPALDGFGCRCGE